MRTSPDCEAIREDLGERARNALPAERLAEVEAHLEGCAACRAEADRAQALEALLARLPSAEPGAAFDASLAAKLAQESMPGQRRTRRRFGLVASGIAAVAAAAAALLVFNTPVEPVAPDPTTSEELALARDLELFRNLELIELLDVLPELEAIEALPEEEPT